MKIRVLSDLHLGFDGYEPVPVDADVVVLAGDIASGVLGVKWAAQTFRDTPIIYVPGNHEYYGGEHRERLADLRECAAERDVHLLDNDAIVIDGVRFLGTTLWTDFCLFGPGDFAERAMRDAQRSINDYYSILCDDRTLRPADTVAWHRESVEFLEARLADSYASTTVVVTHHGVSHRSNHPRYKGSRLNPVFCSDLDALVARSGAALWIHGHVHDAFDYTIGKTRVLVNPHGYPSEVDLNGFDPSLVADVPS
ncbi:MAG TPA: metallophosphoesterase [Gammaproteobacteria bacterium]|nr:metallophosphoesterase [Gammaproteobacteria bacterium]